MTTSIANKYIDRLISKIIFPKNYVRECWGWSDYTTPAGYGQLRVGKTKIPHHRASYILFIGGDISKLDIDHLCRNPECSNPNHLEAITSRENTLRGKSPPALNIKKTHCKQGHEFTADNTWGKKQRICRTCSNINWKKWYHNGGKNSPSQKR